MAMAALIFILIAFLAMIVFPLGLMTIGRWLLFRRIDRKVREGSMTEAEASQAKYGG